MSVTESTISIWIYIVNLPESRKTMKTLKDTCTIITEMPYVSMWSSQYLIKIYPPSPEAHRIEPADGYGGCGTAC